MTDILQKIPMTKLHKLPMTKLHKLPMTRHDKSSTTQIWIDSGGKCKWPWWQTNVMYAWHDMNNINKKQINKKIGFNLIVRMSSFSFLKAEIWKLREKSLISMGPPNSYPSEVSLNPQIPNQRKEKRHLNVPS